MNNFKQEKTYDEQANKAGNWAITTGRSRFWKQVGEVQNESQYSVRTFDCYPDVAAYLLDLNTFDRQRNLSQGNVERFKLALVENSFAVGSMIRLTWDANKWVLTDGQHRLFAIMESGLAAPMTALFCYEPINKEYASIDSVGMLRSKRNVAVSYGFKYTEEFTGRTLDRFLSACGIIEANFSTSSATMIDKLSNARFAEGFVKEMDLVKEWAQGSGVLTHQRGGSIKAPILAVALVTIKHAPIETAKDFWLNAFQNDGLRRRDARRLMNDEIVQSSGDGRAASSGFARRAANLWNWYVSGKGELDKVYTPAKMPDIALTPYPLKNKANNSL